MIIKNSEKIITTLMTTSLIALLISLLAGLLSSFYYVPAIGTMMSHFNLTLIQLRPIHTSFASIWIFLGGMICVYLYLFEKYGQATTKDIFRFKVQMFLWIIAGIGIFFTLLFKITSGREYIGFSPVFSLLILAGWLLFAYTFFSKVWRTFWHQPIYIYMWGIGIVLFIYTFIEGHLYLFKFIHQYPIQDIQIQWKAYGTLVASFNQLVYGSIYYISEYMTGNHSLVKSKTAFALFSIGLLNSFTNYVHHTYHLPQLHLLKWISFVVSMLEVIILVKVFYDVVQLIKKTNEKNKYIWIRFINLSQYWNVFLLLVAILISVPPLNTYIHGTFVIMAHAMGSEIAIDTFILLAVISAILVKMSADNKQITHYLLNKNKVSKTITGINISLIGMMILLMGTGLIKGIFYFHNNTYPSWIQFFPYAFALLGILLTVSFYRLILPLLSFLLKKTIS